MRNFILILIIVLLTGYSINITRYVKYNNEITKSYYDNYCINEYYISLANPSDPIVLELQKEAKKYKICDGFVIE